MFDVGPSDLEIMYFLFFISFIMSVAIYFLTKKNILVAIFSVSVLCNLSVYLISNSLQFALNDLLWLVRFAYSFWPIINILLLVVIGVKFIFNKKYYV